MSDNDSREVVPRSEYEYPLEVRAEAVALVLAFGNCSDAAREMEKRYPERSPARDLIWRWAKKIEPEQFTALQQERKEAVQNRAVDLALLSADKLEEELAAGNIKGQALAITTGINMDKVLKLLEIDKRGGHAQYYGPTLIVSVSREDHEREIQAIEGEVVKSDDDPGEPVASD